MTIKCLAFDLDGTLLLDESKRMDPRTCGFDSKGDGTRYARCDCVGSR